MNLRRSIQRTYLCLDWVTDTFSILDLVVSATIVDKSVYKRLFTVSSGKRKKRIDRNKNKLWPRVSFLRQMFSYNEKTK